jgi:hypothetical protein
MASTLGHIFACAIDVAVSPVPIVAVILTLFSRHARRNGLLFLAGWVLGLIVMTTIVLLLPDSFERNPRGFLASISSVFQLAIGLLFVVIAFAIWRGRPAPGEERPLPSWTARIDGFSAVQALALALALFWTLGSLAIAAPVFYHLIAGNQAEQHLQDWKTWLTHNNATNMFVLLLVVGTVLAGRGLGGLL